MESQLPKSANYEYIKSKSRESYRNKIHSNPEFYQSEKQRIADYKKNRYANDPEYRQKMKDRARQYYEKQKMSGST